MSIQITDWNAMAEALREEIRQLERQYGTGIRPAWISEEIAHLREQAWQYQQKAEKSKGPA